MESLRSVKSEGLFRTGLLIVLFSLHPICLSANTTNPARTFDVKVAGEQVSVVVEDADLSEVLKEIQNKSGIKARIAKELINEKITANFENKNMESALGDILGNHNYVLTFSDDPKKKLKRVLREVEVKSEIIGSNVIRCEMTNIEIPYGSGEREVGGTKGEPSIGPMSFAVAANGDIYVCDSVNNRIQIFSSNGDYLSTITLEKAKLPSEIAFDAKGYLYVLDGNSDLYQYDNKGNNTSVIRVPRLINYGDPMHVIDDVIYQYTCYDHICGDVAIGMISSSHELVNQLEVDQKKIKEQGRVGVQSRNKYIVVSNSQRRVSMEIVNQTGSNSKLASFYWPNNDSWMIISGEDAKGNSYFQSSWLDENEKVISAVHVLDSNGSYLFTVLLPELRSVFWTAKDTEISQDGTIYDFRADLDKLRINICRVEPKGH